MKQGGKHSGGFTIVETLIVLAVSAALAASALYFIAGRQNRTQFQTGINNLQQQLQQSINETVSGYYPNDNDFACTVVGGNPRPQISDNSTVEQGMNGSCIFVGRAMVFGPKFDFDGPRADNYLQYVLAGRRTDVSGSDVRSPQAAQIVPIANRGVTGTYPKDSGVEVKKYESGITYKWISYDGTRITPDGSQAVFAVVSSFAGYGDNSLESKGQNYRLYSIGDGRDWKLPGSSPAIARQIYAYGIGTSDHVYKQVQICFASGGTNQSGKISIGDRNTGGLNVTLQIYDGTVCA